jgi:RNA polymerase sigma factor (sigma-70 family)
MDFAKLKSGDQRAWLDAGSELIPFGERVALYRCPGLSPDEAKGVAIQALKELISDIDDEELDSEDAIRGRMFDGAKKRAIDEIRKKGRLKDQLSDAESLDLESEEGHDRPDEKVKLPSDEAEYGELRRIAADLLDRLSAEDAQLLREAFLKQLLHREIAETHGWKTNTVGNLINQALKRARYLLSSDPRLKEIFDPDK